MCDKAAVSLSYFYGGWAMVELFSMLRYCITALEVKCLILAPD